MTFLEMERTPPTRGHDEHGCDKDEDCEIWALQELRGILQDRIVEAVENDDRYRRGVVRAWEKIAQADTNMYLGVILTCIPTFISVVTGVDVAIVEDDLEVLHEVHN